MAVSLLRYHQKSQPIQWIDWLFRFLSLNAVRAAVSSAATCRGEAVLAPFRLVGPSALWESVTPYLPPWHINRGLALTEQTRREINRRGDISGNPVGNVRFCKRKRLADGAIPWVRMFCRTP